MLQRNENRSADCRPATRRLPRRRAAFVLAAAGLLPLAACGSSDGKAAGVASAGEVDGTDATDATGPTDNGSAKPGAETDPQLALADYEKCMKDHGVNIQSSASGQGGNAVDGGATDTVLNEDQPSPDDFDAADEACEPFLESANQAIDVTPEQQAALNDYMAEIENCMQDKGFDIPMGGAGGNAVGDNGAGDNGPVDNQSSVNGSDFTLPDDVDQAELDRAFSECDEETEMPDELKDMEGAPTTAP